MFLRFNFLWFIIDKIIYKNKIQIINYFKFKLNTLFRYLKKNHILIIWYCATHDNFNLYLVI